MFGQGKATYHLVYIDDLVDGIVLCGEHPAAVGETFILAGPRYTTINELVVRVAAAVGVPPPRARAPLTPLLGAAWLCEMACKPLGLEPPLHRRRCDFFTKVRGFSSAKARRMLGYARGRPRRGAARDGGGVRRRRLPATGASRVAAFPAFGRRFYAVLASLAEFLSACRQRNGARAGALRAPANP